jgi:hypothetical protein
MKYLGFIRTPALIKVCIKSSLTKGIFWSNFKRIFWYLTKHSKMFFLI